MNTFCFRRLLVGAVAIVVVAGCGSNDNTPGQVPDWQQPSTSEPTILESAPTSPIGGTLKIWSDGVATGLSEYTVSNPRQEGDRYLVDLLIQTRQGECIPGTWWVLTSDGDRIEQFEANDPKPGQFKSSGALIAGEKRQGYLAFVVPPGATVTKIVLYHGTINPPKAFWTA